MMYWSPLNKLVRTKQGLLLYAGNTCSLLKCSDSFGLRSRLFRITHNEKLFSEDEMNHLRKIEAVTTLKNKEFQGILKMKTQRYKANYGVFDLTICIAKGCNFKCTYCYEKAPEGDAIISEQTVDNVISYITKRETVKDVIVTLYGGEPLLSVDRIMYIGQQFKKTGLNITYHMITNGYLLTLDTYKKLLTLPLKTIQITIDGPEEIHNKRRPHRTNPDSYAVIIKNLKEIKKYQDENNVHTKLNIRVNIDRTNRKYFIKLRDDLYAIFGSSIYVYAAFVEGLRKDNKDILTPRQKIAFAKKLFDVKYYEARMIPQPFPKLIYCAAGYFNSATIDTTGNVYKCWEDIGIEKYRVCNVNNLTEGKNDKNEAMYYIVNDYLSDKKCKNCFLLNSCCGNCAHRYMENKKRRCELAKYSPKTFIEALYLSKKTEC